MFKYVKFKKVETDKTVLEFQEQDEKVKVHFFDIPAVSLEAEDEQDIDNLIAQQDSKIECTVLDKDAFKKLVKNSAQVKRVEERVNASYKESIAYIAAKYSKEERETWASWQLPEAEKYSYTKDENDAPSLKILADNDGVTVEEFANAVLAKAKNYKTLSANALAQKRTLKQRLLAAMGL